MKNNVAKFRTDKVLVVDNKAVLIIRNGVVRESGGTHIILHKYANEYMMADVREWHDFLWFYMNWTLR